MSRIVSLSDDGLQTRRTSSFTASPPTQSDPVSLASPPFAGGHLTAEPRLRASRGASPASQYTDGTNQSLSSLRRQNLLVVAVRPSNRRTYRADAVARVPVRPVEGPEAWTIRSFTGLRESGVRVPSQTFPPMPTVLSDVPKGMSGRNTRFVSFGSARGTL